MTSILEIEYDKYKDTEDYRDWVANLNDDQREWLGINKQGEELSIIDMWDDDDDDPLFASYKRDMEW